MMEISAADVKRLREMTGAGMMDCKKALSEAGGDFEGAIDFLRKLGQKLSVKRADREAKEGVVIALTSANRNNGVVVRVSCETDFVAKNDNFIGFTQQIAEIALQNLPDTLEQLLALPFEGSVTIADKLQEQVAAIGEKIELADYAKIVTQAGEGQVLPYIHMGNRAGVLVALNLEGPDLIDAGKNVAMQVAAMKPVAVNKDQVNTTVIERELEIAREQIRNEGKPEDMVEKIAQGKLNKFFKESTLLSQEYVKDGSMTVAQYLESVRKGLTVTEFRHVALAR
jgi:elongation factor Ts